ncbi:proline-rich receptor-like protein kinase PERK14 [Drosophila rhopaloa]|uniref:Proline-rich receptor-like protein kinase PERK14 n=1 Tax=Drosophila rhopaloa TaxID=1041015 RepID=A0A6P4FM30_DRORH|nr:proline-rich receptor-like protein kinase PERK14 [Drosophila rhopaloa]
MIKASSASIVILVLSLMALSSAEPLRRRFSARQEEAPPSPSPTGYPEAGITPSVPFDLPSSTAKPESTYLPPDNTYGPPDNTYGPPDNTYGPPEVDSVPVLDSQPEPQPENPIETDDIPETEDESVDGAKLQPADADAEEDQPLVEVAEDGTVIVVASSLDQPQTAQSARLYQRFPQGRRYRQPVPQRLILRRSW